LSNWIGLLLRLGHGTEYASEIFNSLRPPVDSTLNETLYDSNFEFLACWELISTSAVGLDRFRHFLTSSHKSVTSPAQSNRV
jgi:hypothetical protein